MSSNVGRFSLSRRVFIRDSTVVIKDTLAIMKVTILLLFLLFRELEFYVEDSSDAGSLQNSTLQVFITPINDPPVLSFVSDPSIRRSPEPFLIGNSSITLQYTEDDPPLNFGRDVYLRDVDGNIASAILQLTGELLVCLLFVVVVIVVVVFIILCIFQ